MCVQVNTAWKYHGWETLILENEQIQMALLPQLGGKVWDIVYKPRDKSFIWKHPHISPSPAPLYSNYDDYFCGGWDELYPNDMPENINNQSEPDHGELWRLPWQYSLQKATAEEVVVHLWVDTVISSSRVQKWVRL